MTNAKSDPPGSDRAASNLLEAAPTGAGITDECAGADSATTFTDRLPPAFESPQDAPEAKTEPPSFRPGLRVLVVEDDADAGKAFARLLTRRKAEVQVASDGPKGVLAALQFRPEVLLLDIGLPGYDGFELARAMRAHPDLESSLFIATSGYAGEADRAKSLEAGFDFHLTKPVDFEDLVTLIRERFPE
jgi:CheY-like chemotaxis protein